MIAATTLSRLSQHDLRRGLLAGFAPGMLSQSNGHPHITAQWLVPFIVLQVVRLADPARSAVRDLSLIHI